MKKIIALLLSLTFIVATFAGCSAKSTPVAIDDFRVTTYLVADSQERIDGTTLASEDFDIITDVIIFGCYRFDENGKFDLQEDLLKAAMDKLSKVTQGKDINVYINVLGPDSQSDSDDWNDQTADKAERHSKAFESKGFAQNIVDTVNKYDLEGIFFDYEYPIKSKYWKAFDKILLEVDSLLGDKKLGLALADWDLGMSKDVVEAVDMVEMMLYDIFDDDGTHASYDKMVKCSKKFVKKGFDKSKLDFGLPFYARPTDQDSYWYDYSTYADKIDDKGMYEDKELGKTFSFNTPSVIKEKTDYAIDEGFGGMMIWHYACDLPSSNEKSLLKQIGVSIQEHKTK